MKPSIAPFEKFLETYGVRPDLSRRALGFIRPIIDRLGGDAWPLAPESAIDRKEVLRAFNDCLGRPAVSVEIVSCALLKSSPPELDALMKELIPIDIELCEEALSEDLLLQLRLTEQMEKRFEAAMSEALDPDGLEDYERPGPLADLPEELVDGVSFTLMLTFSMAVIAVVGDAKLFDRIAPATRLSQRILFLGCKRSSPETLIVLTA